MTMRIPPGLIAPLIACGIAGAAAVIGGACIPVTSSNPPTLSTGTYVLTSASGHAPPGTVTDSSGRVLRVVADTIVLSTGQQYEERAAIAITLPGGAQQAVAPVLVSRQAYFMTSSTTIVLPVTPYGRSINGSVGSETHFQLTMPDHTIWGYDKR